MNYKETATQNITFISLMAGINVIFCVLFRFLPLSSLLFTLVLPFASTLVMIFCKFKYTIIYIISTLLLTLLISPQDALFYILSPMLSGVVFGVCYKKSLNSSWAIILGTLTTVFVYFVTLPLITLIFETSITESFKILFMLNDEQAHNYFPTFVFVTSLLQTLLSYYIINNDLKKYIVNLKETKPDYLALHLSAIATGLISILLSYIYLPLALVMTFASLALGLYACAKIIKVRKYWILILVIILSLFIFALLYPLGNGESGLCFASSFSIILSFIAVFIKNISNS